MVEPNPIVITKGGQQKLVPEDLPGDWIEDTGNLVAVLTSLSVWRAVILCVLGARTEI